MAFTYLILNSIFITCVVLVIAKKHRALRESKWLTLVALLFLTIVFDNLIVWAGIVEYDASKILGIHIGLIPIEDLFYAVLAAGIVPVLWKQFETSAPREDAS